MAKHVRKLGKAGKYSYSVTLPMELIKELGWKLRQKVVVKRVGKRIVVEDWKEG